MAQLAVFQGGFSLSAAGAVLEPLEGTGWIEDVLHQLLDRSLLRMSLLEGAHARYSLLESVRLFALSAWGEPAVLEAALARHRRWFCQVGRRCMAQSRGRLARESLAELVVEAANLQAAWEGGVVAETVEAALAMDGLLEVRGSGERRWRFLEQAIQRACDAGAVQIESTFWRRYGTSLHSAGERERSLEALEKAEALLHTDPDDGLLFELAAARAEWERRSGSLEAAQSRLQQARKYA
ncbi:MAG: tetratricopeptide (TPR) repeat protein [Myxococcota bacterium]